MTATMSNSMDITISGRTLDISTGTGRLVAADAMADAGREAEAKLLRSGFCRVIGRRVVDHRMCYFEVSGDFSNVYTVYVVPRSETARFLAAFPGAAKVTRQHAIRWGITRVREAKRDGEQWFGGLCEGRGRADLSAPVTTQLESCLFATLDAIDMAEMHRDATQGN